MEGIIILGAAGLAKEFFFYIKRAMPEIKCIWQDQIDTLNFSVVFVNRLQSELLHLRQLH